MGPDQRFLILLGSGQPSLVWVWKITHKNSNFFNFLPFRSKKIPSGWVKKYPGQSRVDLLFIAGQNYARVWSGPISSVRGIEELAIEFEAIWPFQNLIQIVSAVEA